MASMDKWSPKVGESMIRDPRDTGKKKGVFYNFPRYMYFGGADGRITGDQSGTKGINLKKGNGQNANGPISDRGRGRSK